MNKNRVTIVTYHYVRNLSKSRYPDINGLEIGLFKKQLEYFSENYSFITLPEFIEAIDANIRLPDNAILLTFNDNYSDHFRNVFPILNEMNISGCFFPEIRAVEDDIVLPNHKIHYILATEPNKKMVIEKIFELLNEFRSQYSLAENKQYFKKLAVESTYDPKEVIFIKKLVQNELPENLSEIVIDRLFEEFVDITEKELNHELYMNKEQIKCMYRHGMYFGIIGYNHKRLPSLSKDMQKKEIELSRQWYLNEGINPELLTVSYPWQAYNDQTINILKKNNIKAAFTGGSVVADLDTHSRYELPRFDTNDFKDQTLKVN